MREMEEIETITDDRDEPEGEEPWCPACRGYTDYRRKWSTVSRADTDGGVYPEVSETPHCIECERPMHYLGACRKLVLASNGLALATWGVCGLATLTLFDLSTGSVLAFGLLSLLSFGLSRIPRKSRQVVKAWKRWKEEESLKELIDPSPKE